MVLFLAIYIKEIIRDMDTCTGILIAVLFLMEKIKTASVLDNRETAK